MERTQFPKSFSIKNILEYSFIVQSLIMQGLKELLALEEGGALPSMLKDVVDAGISS